MCCCAPPPTSGDRLAGIRTAEVRGIDVRRDDEPVSGGGWRRVESDPSLSVYTLNKLLIFTHPRTWRHSKGARPAIRSCLRCARRMYVACWRPRRREEEVGGR